MSNYNIHLTATSEWRSFYNYFDYYLIVITTFRLSIEIRQFPSQFFYQNLLTDAPHAQILKPITVQWESLNSSSGGGGGGGGGGGANNNNGNSTVTAFSSMYSTSDNNNNNTNRREITQHTLSPVRFIDLRASNEVLTGKSYRNDSEVQLNTSLLSAMLPHWED